MGDRRQRRLTGVLDGYAVGPDASRLATEAGLRRVADGRSIVLVEGISDQIAVETLAVCLHHDLDAAGVVVLPINGAQAAPGLLRRFGPAGSGQHLSGLCDAAEQGCFVEGLSAAGIGTPADRSQLAELGFFVCVDDLEAELIRCVGEASITALLDACGDLPSFRTLQKQRAWSDRPFEVQVHRWLRAGATRNVRYAHLLVAAVEPSRAPAPLLGVLDAALV